MASAFRSTPASEASPRGSESVSTRNERTHTARQITTPPRRDPSRGVNFERLPHNATALHCNSSEAHHSSATRRSREEDQSSRSADEHAGQCAADGSTSAPEDEATEGARDGDDAVATRMVVREDSDLPAMPNEMPIVFRSIGEKPIEIGRISLSTSADLPVLLVAVTQILCNLSPSSSELQAVLARGDPTDGNISLPKAFLAGDVRLTDAATNLPIQTNEAFQGVAGKWMRQEAARVAALLRIRVAQIEKGLKERAGPFHVMALLELWDLVADPTTISWVSDGVINSMLHVALNTETMDVLGLCVVVIWMLIVAKHKTKAQSSLHLPSEEIAHVLLLAIHRLHAMRREEGLRKNAGENGDFHSDANEMSLTDASFLNSAAFDAEFSKSFSSTGGGKGLDLMKSFGSIYGVKSMDHFIDTTKDDDSDEHDSSRAADAGTCERFDTDRFNGWFGVDYVGETGEWRPDMFFYTGSTESHAIQIPASKRLELASLLKPQSLLWAVSALYELLSRDRDATLLAILNGAHRADGGAAVGLTQLVSLLQDEELKTCRTAIEVLRLIFTSSPDACVQLFEEWPWVFAQFIGGWSNPNVPAQLTHKGFELRCQVAALLTIAATHAADAISWQSSRAHLELPRLVGGLRAVCTPLVVAVTMNHPAASAAYVERAAVLLRLIVLSQWALATSLSAISKPLKATSALLCHGLRLLSLLDDTGEKSPTQASSLLRHVHAKALRNAGTGLLSTISLDITPSRDPGARLARQRKIQEKAGLEQELDGFHDTVRSFQLAEVCSIRIQSYRRGLVARREQTKRHKSATQLQAFYRGALARFVLSRQTRRHRVSPAASRKKKQATEISHEEAKPIEKKASKMGEATMRLLTLRLLCSRLLKTIDSLTEKSPPSRSAECAAAAVCSLTKTMVDTIRSTGAQEHQFPVFLSKLLVLCRRIQQHAVASSGPSGSIASTAEHNVSNEEQTEGMTLTESPTTKKVYSPSKRQWMLCGRPAACHAYLSGTIVTILKFILDEADNETEKFPTKIEERPRRGSSASSRKHDSCLTRQSLVSDGFEPEQLKVLVGMLSSSPLGASQGCAAVWLAVRYGMAKPLGELGAVEGLFHVLRSSTRDLSPDSDRYVDARWACAALWLLLAEEPQNLPKALAAGGTTLVRLARAISMPSKTDSAARDSPSKSRSRPKSPVTAKEPQSVEELKWIARHDGLRKGVFGCLECLLQDSSLLPQICSLGIPQTLRELAVCDWLPLTHRMAALRSMDSVAQPLAEQEGGEHIVVDALMFLLKDREIEMRCLACRMLARVAMRNGERVISQANGIEALIKQVKSVIEACQTPEILLLRDSLNAVLNLSGAKCSQELIVRCGLQTLTSLWSMLNNNPSSYGGDGCASPDSPVTDIQRELDETSHEEILELTHGILDNLSRNPALRTPMYRAELRLKSEVWANQSVNLQGGNRAAACCLKDEGAMEKKRIIDERNTELRGPSAGAKGGKLAASALSSASASRLQQALAAGGKKGQNGVIPFGHTAKVRPAVIRSRGIASALAERKQPLTKGGISSASTPSLKSMLVSSKRWDLNLNDSTGTVWSPSRSPRSSSSPRSLQLNANEQPERPCTASPDSRYRSRVESQTVPLESFPSTPPPNYLKYRRNGNEPRSAGTRSTRTTASETRTQTSGMRVSASMPEFQPSVTAAHADRWHPTVVGLSVKPAVAGEAKLVRERASAVAAREYHGDAQAAPVKEYLEQYVEGNQPLSFTISLPASQVYTPSFKFTQGEHAPEKLSRTPAEDRLVGWEGASGSKIGEDFPSYPLAAGRVVRLYHSSVQRNWRAPRREAHGLPPKSLKLLQLPMLPLPPPPQPGSKEILVSSFDPVSSYPEVPRRKPPNSKLCQRSKIVLCLDLEISAEAQADPPATAEQVEPAAHEFDFAEEEVTKIEEEIDPFDLL